MGILRDMQTPLLLKIRILLAVFLGIILFGHAAWGLIAADNPLAALTLVHYPRAWGVVGSAVIWGCLAAVITFLISGRYAGNLAPLAILAGVTLWAMKAHDMEQLLIKNPQLEVRTALFYSMIWESFIWFCLLFLPFVLFRFLSWCFLPDFQENDPDDKQKQGRPLSAIAHEISYLKRTLTNLHTGIKECQRAFSLDNLDSFHKKVDWKMGLGSLLISSVIGGLLLKVLSQSPSVDIISITGKAVTLAQPLNVQQIFFAVFISFLLAAYISHRLFPEVSYWFMLPGPLLIAGLTYFRMAGSSLEPLTNAAPSLILSSSRAATILPVQFMAFGILGIVVGYWWSVRNARNQAYIELHGEPDSDKSSFF